MVLDGSNKTVNTCLNTDAYNTSLYFNTLESRVLDMLTSIKDVHGMASIDPINTLRTRENTLLVSLGCTNREDTAI